MTVIVKREMFRDVVSILQKYDYDPNSGMIINFMPRMFQFYKSTIMTRNEKNA